MKAGYIDPESLLFAGEHLKQVRDVVRTKADALRTLDAACSQIFRQQPFYRTRELVPALRRLLASRSFEQATNSS